VEETLDASIHAVNPVKCLLLCTSSPQELRATLDAGDETAARLQAALEKSALEARVWSRIQVAGGYSARIFPVAK
jgi:hypothetical protein